MDYLKYACALAYRLRKLGLCVSHRKTIKQLGIGMIQSCILGYNDTKSAHAGEGHDQRVIQWKHHVGNKTVSILLLIDQLVYQPEMNGKQVREGLFYEQ